MVLVSSAERNYQERIRLERMRDNSNPFELAEEKFQKLFRLPRSAAFQLVSDLDDQRLDEGFIPKHLKVLSALQFFAQGSYQAAVGQDNFIALSQPSVSRCIKITADLIVEKLLPNCIKFPMTESEKLIAMTEFQELFNMPNTLGAVDGTHISIAKPSINHPTAPGNLFYNRKGFYSINCQIVCSAKGKIIGLNPNFPGSTHDAAIWRASTINHFFKSNFLSGERNQWLLGDKGYPLQPWLMTPLMAPTTEAERAYNNYALNDDNHYDVEIQDVNIVVEEENQDFLIEARQIPEELIQTHFNY
ncbi:unnamed protein product [Arctia plantaginis]|uniref:Putative nuclease HARBI1 n=1 Tax=Arctia plantaginis TaxID=874455 RepID=A0A8S0YMU9_ARCPL|nr:unnamed protein product [Arctia plantaginis]